MKILQINKYGYRKGGSETHFFALADLLRENGHDIRIFTASNEDERLPREIDFGKASLSDILKMFWNREAARKLDEFIADWKPDVAHLHNIYHHLSPSIIHLLKKMGVPIVMTLHDYKVICPNYRLFNQGRVCERCKGGRYYNCFLTKCVKDSRVKSLLATIEAYLHRKILKSYEKVDIFIAPSAFLKDKFAEFGIPSEKIKVIRNFADIEELEELPITSETKRPDNYILYFGRLSKEKGIGILPEAMKLLDSQVVLKIAGDGPELDNSKFKIQNSKLEGRVELVGRKTGDELAELISNAKVVVLPSIWYENMPMSAIEAMAMGRPVIASRIGGMPEIVEDGLSGYLFEPGNASQLAECIKRALAGNLEEMGRRARENASKFGRATYLQELETVYRNIKG